MCVVFPSAFALSSSPPTHPQAEKEGLKYYGLDLKAGEIVDNVERGVLEPAMSKVKSLRFATEAAVTIMRIDDRITIRAAEQAQGGGHMH